LKEKRKIISVSRKTIRPSTRSLAKMSLTSSKTALKKKIIPKLKK